MKIFAEPIQEVIEGNSSFILLYAFIITILVIYLLFKKMRVRARYKTFIKMRFGIAKIGFSFERNEDAIFQELWEQNEDNLMKRKDLEKQINTIRRQNIAIGIILLFYAFLIFNYKSGWKLFFSILVKIAVAIILLGLIFWIIK